MIRRNIVMLLAGASMAGSPWVARAQSGAKATARAFDPVYFAAAGGVAMPASGFNDPSMPGWRVEGDVGLDARGSHLGVRLGFGYSRHKPYGWVDSRGIADAELMNADADIKVPILNFTPDETTVIRLYGLAGATFTSFRHVVEGGAGGYYIGNNGPGNGFPADDNSWHGGLGYNAGGGMEFQTGGASVFVESRYVPIKGVAARFATVPLVAGVRFR